MTKTIIFIDILSNLDIDKVENDGCGASEFQLHILAKKMAETHNVFFFSKNPKNVVLKNIHYLPLSELLNSKYHDENSIIIIQRMIHMIANTDENKRMPIGLENFDIRNIFKNNLIVCWCHDMITKGLISGDYITLDKKYYNDENIKNRLLKISNDKNFKIVCVSEFQKKQFETLLNYHDIDLNNLNIIVIYNALYSEYYQKEKYIVNINQLCYCSSWAKGVDKILQLYEHLLEKDNSFKLVLLSPGYESISKDQKYIDTLTTRFKDNISIIGKLSKKSLSKIIGESLCLIGPKFIETFGCVYEEAYYLETPVITDDNTGGSHEIINPGSFIDYNNKDDFVNKILNLKQNRETVNLNDIFRDVIIIEKWNNLLDL